MTAFAHTIQPATLPNGEAPAFSCPLAPGIWVLGAGGMMAVKVSAERLAAMPAELIRAARLGAIGWFIGQDWHAVAAAFSVEFWGVDLG